MKLDSLKIEFEKYVLSSKADIIYKEKLINHFHYNPTWISLRKLELSDYIARYFELKGKSFYLKLSDDGYKILQSDSGNRDAFSNVHKYIKEVINAKYHNEILDSDYYSINEIEDINSEILLSNNDFSWNQKPKEKESELYETNLQRYKRDITVAKNALIKARFLCEYNINDKVFLRKGSDDIYYTEAHHLIPLSKNKEFKYSLDIEENVISLCSHCHNLLHYGRYEDKETILRKLYNERYNALSKCGIDITFETLLSYYK